MKPRMRAPRCPSHRPESLDSAHPQPARTRTARVTQDIHAHVWSLHDEHTRDRRGSAPPPVPLER
eukprot:43638-Eustigmatos_ZCMA.PRE.1